jgi:hypothetical protein
MTRDPFARKKGMPIMVERFDIDKVRPCDDLPRIAKPQAPILKFQ